MNKQSGSALSADTLRLPAGTGVDTSKAITFNYDGVAYQGVEGDTLASALLANGVRLVGRSFKYHRPRGIYTAGPEEPNALMQLEQGAFSEPNTRATQVDLYQGLTVKSQNCFPSVGFDIGAINSVLSRFLPAGFYYKTFMWPASMWMTYEKFIRRAAGLGKSPEEPDADNYEQLYAHCDVLIAGAGIAGISAAIAAAETGARVILMDEQCEPGGAALWNAGTINGQAAHEWVREQVAVLNSQENVQVVSRCTVTAYLDHNYLTAAERLTDHLPLDERAAGSIRQRFWKIRARRVVLATGSIERPLLFADNDRPGVMLAGAVRHYINRYAVLPAKQIVVFTNNDSAYATALDAQRAGAEVTLVDMRSAAELDAKDCVKAIKDTDIRLMANSVVAGLDGKRAISSARISGLDASGQNLTGDIETVPCQVVAASGGWNPTVHLHSQARGKLAFVDSIKSFVPEAAPAGDDIDVINPHTFAGACNGAFDSDSCLQQGAAAGASSAKSATTSNVDQSVSDSDSPTQLPTAEMSSAEGVCAIGDVIWVVPTEHAVGQGPRKHFHDLQNDVTVADIHLAAREGYQSVEHLKRYTTTGMGTDQGKTSNVNALAVMAELRNASIPEVGFTTFRPPFTPVTFGAVAGQYTKELFLQERYTPMHPWHVDNDAVFEDVGDWKRPWYFPRSGESMHQAVQRESLSVRKSVGMVDASTLGKIDIQGEDSAWFLDMIYTNGWQKLAVGKCRYGLMLNEHGMVFDDGVTTKIGENHFHMTTTTGGAARVMGWLEEWLQTEWPEKKVYCTSVTEQWAVAAVNGPNAARLLQKVAGKSFDLAALPHMSCCDATVAGVPARIFRISFTGEMSFEINVPARHGLHMWNALIKAGEEFDLCVYGTETMHVLRAEKGFIIAGQDTDGTVTPLDLDMGWIVNNKKDDFLGKRSLSRSDTKREGRRQLTGVLTDDPEEVLPEGAHLVDEIFDSPPMQTIGHITSSYYSPNVGRSIAMGLVDNGISRKGESVKIRLMDGRVIPAKLTSPVFYDESGERMHAAS